MPWKRTVDVAIAGVTKTAIHNGLSGLEKLLSINVAVVRVPRVPTQRGQFALDTYLAAGSNRIIKIGIQPGPCPSHEHVQGKPQ